LGNRQQYGVDYQDTFAPVAMITAVRTPLVVTAMKGWQACQTDVSNVFLHGDLEEGFYMILSQGHTHYGSRMQPTFTVVALMRGNLKVCKLHKSVSGLK